MTMSQRSLYLSVITTSSLLCEIIGCAQLQENLEMSVSRRCNELSRDLAAHTRSDSTNSTPSGCSKADWYFNRNVPVKPQQHQQQQQQQQQEEEEEEEKKKKNNKNNNDDDDEAEMDEVAVLWKLTLIEQEYRCVR
jgi:hypothetical protein